MTELVTRLYATDQAAKAVVDALKAEGFSANRITWVPAGSVAGVTAQLVTDLATGTSARVLSQADVNGLADAVARGAALVSVSPPFGAAYAAEQVLGGQRTEAAPRAEGSASVGDDPAPLSEALHVPVLTPSQADTGGGSTLSEEPAPLSDVLHLPVLVHSNSGEGAKLIEEPAPLSHALGLPVLTTHASKTTSLLPNDWSLSRLLGLPLLSKETAPRSAEPIQNTLSDNPAPLSSTVGAPVLTRSK